jgi:hypothetical protein
LPVLRRFLTAFVDPVFTHALALCSEDKVFTLRGSLITHQLSAAARLAKVFACTRDQFSLLPRCVYFKTIDPRQFLRPAPKVDKDAG